MRVPVLFAPVPHRVAQRAAAAGAALDVPAAVAACAAADTAAGCDDPVDSGEAVGVPCWPHAARATASVAVTTVASAPRFAILRETPMTAPSTAPVPLQTPHGFHRLTHLHRGVWKDAKDAGGE